MQKLNRYIFSILLLIITFLSLVTNWYNQLVIALSVVLIFWLLFKLGKGIVLRESIALLYVLTCLVMPLIGYDLYVSGNQLSRIWVGFMQVSPNVYFGFALPAIAAFCMAITLPLKNNEDEGIVLEKLIQRIKLILSDKDNHRNGLMILVVGFMISVITPYLPSGLQFFSNLFYFASFAGFLYVYFSVGFSYRIWVMLFFSITILANALSLGMFTIVAYMGITLFSFFFLGNKTSFLKKVFYFSAAIVFFIVLQNAKGTYRKFVWGSDYKGNKAVLFAEVFVENLQKGDALIEPKAFFPLYVRFNQGFNVSLVMKRIPDLKPHDGGSRLATVAASAFVPRFLWPDKPEAGGKFNMTYYAGRVIRKMSTNVGPLGEAYGSFGIAGGIVFMFLLGFFIRWVYLKMFTIARRIPLLICWLPVLFFQVTYSAETDTLAILNSLIKSAFFIFLLYKILPQWFGNKQLVSLGKTTYSPVSG